jgi:hypothetical protein
MKNQLISVTLFLTGAVLVLTVNHEIALIFYILVAIYYNIRHMIIQARYDALQRSYTTILDISQYNGEKTSNMYSQAR